MINLLKLLAEKYINSLVTRREEEKRREYIRRNSIDIEYKVIE